MKAHTATIKAIPRSIGRKKQVYFAFFAPGLSTACGLSPVDHRKLSPLVATLSIIRQHRQRAEMTDVIRR
jgi:hypothetical protein